jgi:hypothetical protein
VELLIFGFGKAPSISGGSNLEAAGEGNDLSGSGTTTNGGGDGGVGCSQCALFEATLNLLERQLWQRGFVRIGALFIPLQEQLQSLGVQFSCVLVSKLLQSTNVCLLG